MTTNSHPPREANDFSPPLPSALSDEPPSISELSPTAFHDLAHLETAQLEAMRPILCLGLGGSGQRIATHLKAILTERFGETWRKKIIILVFDTADEPEDVRRNGHVIRLEPGSELFNIGHVPVGRIKRNLAELDSIRQRLGSTLQRLPALTMRGQGTKSIRSLSTLALYWHFNRIVLPQLKNAIWRLAAHELQVTDTAIHQQSMNAYLFGSLAGGTGSGLLAEMAYLVRSLVQELGAHGDFCHITGLAVLPQAFHGVSSPHLQPNTAAALREINHLMLHGGFTVTYPDGQTVTMPEAPFDLFNVIDGVDERGQTWANIDEVCAIAAEAVFLQMASQLGRRGENDFDNLVEVLLGRTAEGLGTFMGSLGLGYLEFPAPAVVSLCAGWLAREQIEQVWLHPLPDGEWEQSLNNPLPALMPAQIKLILFRDPETGSDLRLDLRQPGWLRQKPAAEIVAAATTYVREFGYARVEEGILRQIEQNSRSWQRQQQEQWLDWLNALLFTPDVSLLQLAYLLHQARIQLHDLLAESHRHISDRNREQEQQRINLAQSEAALTQASTSLPWGRSGRIQQALDQYFQLAADLFACQIDAGYLQAQRRIWGELAEHVSQLERQVQIIIDRLGTAAAQIQATTSLQARRLQAGSVSRLSLADEPYVRQLYMRHAPAQINLRALTHYANQGDGWQPLSLADLSADALRNWFHMALAEPFAPILRQDIEAVIVERAAEMSPRARYQQLLRLAAPSWSIDRTRLPEGGAGLARVEVLGVFDAGTTHFKGETTLVSTGDPYRLVSLVVVAGAPPTALQQYDRYQQALQRAVHPLYVLPQFMTDAGQGRLAFALASIFEFVFNQGTHFYYRPADALAPPVRLGNGLDNAMESVAHQDDLIREMMERVESQVAHLGVQQTIDILSAYYTVVPEGRTPLDEVTRDLKQRVRAYADELRQIDAFSKGMKR
ncbi:MAG: hypothetical protein KC418_22225 [Anaerolineales bacterium]|nr:hypothetical protein [Anaerolineales bacterium]